MNFLSLTCPSASFTLQFGDFLHHVIAQLQGAYLQLTEFHNYTPSFQRTRLFCLNCRFAFVTVPLNFQMKSQTWIALARGGTFCASPSNRGTVETGSLVDIALPRRSPVRLALTHIGFFRTSSVYAGYAAFAYDLAVKSCSNINRAVVIRIFILILLRFLFLVNVVRTILRCSN